MQFINLLRPHRTVPKTSWTAPNQWSLSPMRLFILAFGLSIFGFGEALLIQSTLGNTPWAVLSQGLSRHTPLSLGWSTFFISIVVLLGWIPLKQKPGFGTLANIVIIAFMLQIGNGGDPVFKVIPIVDKFFEFLGYFNRIPGAFRKEAEKLTFFRHD